MKQCPNPDCIIYTRLDELPDTYLRCPQCGEALVDVPPATGALSQAYPDQDSTSPYVPPPRRQPVYSAQQYIQQPLADESVYLQDPDADEYDEGAPQAAGGSLRVLTAPGGPNGRSFLVALGIVALVITCAALAVSLSSRMFVESRDLSGASATQTAIAALRPAINTPIAILPTLDVSSGDTQSEVDSAPLTGGSAPNPTATLVVVVTNPAPPPPSGGALPSVPVADALMCARLEGGQPVAPTNAYHPTDPFNLAIKTQFGPGGAETVLTRWYGPGGAFLYELRQNYSQSGTYYAGFTLTKQTPWPNGDYHVDIYTNNASQLAQSVSFSVIP